MAYRKLKTLIETTIKFKKRLPAGLSKKFYLRAEYLIIKARQISILNARITRNVKKYYKSKCLKSWTSASCQKVLSELHLDTETFFYMAAKLNDLFNEGFSDLYKNKKFKKNSSVKQIAVIRNNLLEHSHNGRNPLENEECAFYLSKKYGVCVRSKSRADGKSKSYSAVLEQWLPVIIAELNSAKCNVGE